MKVLLSWLKEYVDMPYKVEQLEERLPALGLGIEGLERVGDDAVFDLEIAANRGDLMSVLGIARELAAAAGTRIRPPAGKVTEDRLSVRESTRVEVKDTSLCPRFTARMIVDVNVGPSPSWLARRLEACGLRAINNIVDITNYAMFEMGQPMHAFDFDKLVEGRLIVRLAKRGEHLTTLDGVERNLDADTLVVADGERAAGIAGIIGGANTEIGPQTKRVLLEAASWNPAMIRRTSRRLGVRTESSARFERGVDTAGIPAVQDRAIALMQELAGGRILKGMIDVFPNPQPFAARTVDLRWPSVARLLGTDVPEEQGIAILRSLGFDVAGREGAVCVIVPTYRRDVEREEDLVEEVARHYGYERIPSTLPVEATAQGTRADSIVAENAIRSALVRAGLVEALTVSLTHPAVLDTLLLPADHPWRKMVALKNPMVDDHTHLRTTLLPGLLNAAQVNTSRSVPDVQVFELGRTFHPDRTAVAERRRLDVLMMGAVQQATWNLTPAAVRATYYHLKGVVEALLDELRIDGVVVSAAPSPWLHPGRAARLSVDTEVLGTLGQLHPEVSARYDLPADVFVADLDVDALLRRATLRPRFVPLPRFPAVRRDIALILPTSTSPAHVEEVIRKAGGALLESVEIFDVYAGAPIPEGHRNLAYTLTFRASDRTLAADEVETVVGAIKRALVERLRAKIRE